MIPGRYVGVTALFLACAGGLLSVRCEPPYGPYPCPTLFTGTVDAGSEWYEQADIDKASWKLTGTYEYKDGYYFDRSNPTFEMDIAWSGEPYEVSVSSCSDTTPPKDIASLPVSVYLKTSDGAFDDTFHATASGIGSDTITFLFDEFSGLRLRTMFTVPVWATNQNPNLWNCPQPTVVINGLYLHVKDRTLLVPGANDPLTAWMGWKCDDSVFPIGTPVVDTVSPGP